MDGLDLSLSLGKGTGPLPVRFVLLIGGLDTYHDRKEWMEMMLNLPNVHPIRRSETDDLGAWLVLDEVVHFAVGNEIFVRRVLREVRKLQVMEISRVRIFGVLLIPEVLED